jgi:hypothetical protein
LGFLPRFVCPEKRTWKDNEDRPRMFRVGDETPPLSEHARRIAGGLRAEGDAEIKSRTQIVFTRSAEVDLRFVKCAALDQFATISGRTHRRRGGSERTTRLKE